MNRGREVIAPFSFFSLKAKHMHAFLSLNIIISILSCFSRHISRFVIHVDACKPKRVVHDRVYDIANKTLNFYVLYFRRVDLTIIVYNNYYAIQISGKFSVTSIYCVIVIMH